MLTTPPAAPPSSAEIVLAEMRSSWIISSGTETRMAPVVSSRLSVPSMETELLRERMPPEVKPESLLTFQEAAGLRPVDWPEAGVMPGAVRMKLT